MGLVGPFMMRAKIPNPGGEPFGRSLELDPAELLQSEMVVTERVFKLRVRCQHLSLEFICLRLLIGFVQG